MNHRGVWLTAAVLAVVVLLAQVAGASTRDEPTSLALSVSAEVSGTAATASLPEQASSVTTEKSAKESVNEAIADRARTTEKTEKTEKTEATEAAEDEVNDMPANPPAKAPRDSTTGARPGWGCGDTNHKHSGPPGRHDATPPPGCAKP